MFGTGLSDADFLEALGSKFPTVRAFLDYVIASEDQCFFLDPSRRREFIKAVRVYCPEVEDLTIAAADRVCDHIFELLGSGPTSLGEHIDWHVDFKTGHRFNPRKYYADIRPSPYPGGYDIKVPWELSRCQHFVWLGQAYWFTGNEKYAQEFRAQVLDWIEQNPVEFGVNWACTMDVAIRVVNWLWGYYFFKDSPSLTDEFLLEFFKSLLSHGQHIRRNLENQGAFTNNHYLSNLVALIYLGILCPEFKEATEWSEFGLRELWQEMFKQVYPDGMNFEASIAYHRLATELFLSPILLCQLNHIQVPIEVMERLEKMLEFVMYITNPDGTVPLIGDNDSGRLHRLKAWCNSDQEWVDYRYLLAIGAVLFRRKDFGRAAGDQWEETIWLFGSEAVSHKEVLDQESVEDGNFINAFPNSGIYVIRNDDFHAVIGAGSVGQNSVGGHAHNDTLSFTLHASGINWLIDPGTYVYTVDYAARNQFRSTSFHNTIMVDGQEINRFDNRYLFRMRDNARVVVHQLKADNGMFIFDAEHHGYERLDPPVCHRRQICFSATDRIMIVRDIMVGSGARQLDLFLHFDNNLSLDAIPSDPLAVRAKHPSGQNLFVLSLSCHPLSMNIKQGWLAPGYGTQEPAPIIVYHRRGELPTEFVIAFYLPEMTSVSPLEQIKMEAQKVLSNIFEL